MVEGDEVHDPVAVRVHGEGPHGPVGVREPRPLGGVSEGEVPVAQQEAVRRAVRGLEPVVVALGLHAPVAAHVEIEEAIAVQVSSRESERGQVPAEARPLAHVLEAPRAVVAEEPERRAPLPGSPGPPDPGEREVRIPVRIEVGQHEPRGSGAGSEAAHLGLLGEPARAVVPVEEEPIRPGDHDVQRPVPIDVGHACAVPTLAVVARPAVAGADVVDPGAAGDLGEC